MNHDVHLEVSQENGAAFVMRQLEGEIVMLNLLKFRDVADYSRFPKLATPEPISGQAAYDLYIQHTLPHLQDSGGELLFIGQGGHYLIGPSSVRWDVAMLVKHKSVETFMNFAKNENYLTGMGHREAALEDSRLLPLSPKALPVV